MQHAAKPLSTATIPAQICEYDFLDLNASCDRIDRLVAEKLCLHAGSKKIVSLDAQVLALFDANCLSSNTRTPRCQKSGDGGWLRLLLCVLPSPRLKARYFNVRVVSKSDKLEVRSPDDPSGAMNSTTVPRDYCVYPSQYGGGGDTQCTPVNIAVKRHPLEQPSRCFVEVQFDVSMIKAKTQPGSIVLNVALPTHNSGDAMLESVLSATVQMLVKDCWEFVKSRWLKAAPKQADEVCVRIGGNVIHLKDSDALTSILRGLESKARASDLEAIRVTMKEERNIRDRIYGMREARGGASTARDTGDLLGQLHGLDREHEVVLERLVREFEAAAGSTLTFS